MCQLKKHAYAELLPSENHASQGKNVRNSAFPRALSHILKLLITIIDAVTFLCQQQLLLSADNLCKQFAPRSECQTWSGSKPFDTG